MSVKAQDEFLLAPILPHKCGSEELCRAPCRWSAPRFTLDLP